MDTLFVMAEHTHKRFIIIIDEWDAILREFDDMTEVTDKFVNFLSRMFKSDDTTNEYIIHRELATGLDYADLVMIPRKKSDKPAIIIELKNNTAVDTTIDQIHRKNYPTKVLQYTNNLYFGFNALIEKKKQKTFCHYKNNFYLCTR